MNQGKTVWSQSMSFFPEYEFNKSVDSYSGNYRVQTFACREHFSVMRFVQLTCRESLQVINSHSS